MVESIRDITDTSYQSVLTLSQQELNWSASISHTRIIAPSRRGVNIIHYKWRHRRMYMSRIGDATSYYDVRCEVYSLLLASINILVTLRFTRLVYGGLRRCAVNFTANVVVAWRWKFTLWSQQWQLAAGSISAISSRTLCMWKNWTTASLCKSHYLICF